jgi:hypothetical protein
VDGWQLGAACCDALCLLWAVVCQGACTGVLLAVHSLCGVVDCLSSATAVHSGGGAAGLIHSRMGCLLLLFLHTM